MVEHFYPWEVNALVEEWVRVLKPGAKMVIECPCFDKMIALANVPEVTPNFVYWGLFGDPRYQEPDMMHKWAYTRRQLTIVMADSGLVEIQHQPAKFHEPLRDMRVIGFKPQDESRIITQ